jgi:hypothetical protein
LAGCARKVDICTHWELSHNWHGLEIKKPIEVREMKEYSAFLTVAVLAVSLLLLASHLIAEEATVFDQVLAKLTAH